MVFDVAAYHFDGRTSRGEQAEAAAPEVFTPQFLAYLRILLFEQARAGAFVRVDELRQRGFRLRAEQDMHVVKVMVPFLDGYPVFGRDVLEDLTGARGNRVVEHFASVFRDEHEMIMHKEHRMMIRLQFHYHHLASKHVRLIMILPYVTRRFTPPPTLTLRGGGILGTTVETLVETLVETHTATKSVV